MFCLAFSVDAVALRPALTAAEHPPPRGHSQDCRWRTALNQALSSLLCWPAGQLTESEKDRLDEEVGRSVKECTNSIRRVEAAVEGAKAGLNTAVLAHRHGVVSCAARARLAASAPLWSLQPVRTLQPNNGRTLQCSCSTL